MGAQLREQSQKLEGQYSKIVSGNKLFAERVSGMTSMFDKVTEYRRQITELRDKLMEKDQQLESQDNLLFNEKNASEELQKRIADLEAENETLKGLIARGQTRSLLSLPPLPLGQGPGVARCFLKRN